MNESFIHQQQVLKVFAKLFLEGYGLSRPVVEPDRLVHWQAQMQLLSEQAGLSPSPLGRVPTFVFGGYFYNFSTPPPDAGQIAASLDEGRRLGARQFLVPTVRDDADTTALESAGFQRLPCFVESSFRMPTGVDEDLRAHVGSYRFREIKRMARRADEKYEVRFMSAAELEADPALLHHVVRLHSLNIAQHGFITNFFEEPVLRYLCASPLGKYIFVEMYNERATGIPVQALATLAVTETGELFCMAQGIDHARVGREINLYVASLYRLYEQGFARGIRTFHFGRGGAENKRRVGADEFRLLNHWMKSDEPDFEREIGRLAAAMKPIMESSAGLIAETD